MKKVIDIHGVAISDGGGLYHNPPKKEVGTQSIALFLAC